MKSEFEFINNIKKRLSATRIGDDCAVLPKDQDYDQLVTADLLVEDVDFRLDWTTPQFLGHKALAVSLSDIAAMAGTPKWAMVSMGVPRSVWKTDFVDAFYEGWGKLASRFGIELIGGDVSRTPDKIVIDSIVAGEIEKGTAILRSGARAGDGIFVTGSLGGAAGGLFLLESGLKLETAEKEQKAMIERQLSPMPRIETARQIRSLPATSMIDLSDGLSSDISHISLASGVGAEIVESLIPVDPNLSVLARGRRRNLDFAFNGGEDFELLFTADEKKFSAPMIPDIRRIGTITANVGRIEIIRDGKTSPLQAKGFRHF